MSDEAILALVRNQLDAVFASEGVRARPQPRGRKAAAPPAPRPAAAAKKPKKRRAGAPRRRVDSAEREQLLTSIEKIVKGGSGMSASEVSKAAGMPQTRVASALKELKLAKRIFQGGDRRFARYAGDAKSAEQASLNARKSATGPTRPAKKGRKKSK
ncbi:MAG TPA: hypothetical protein VHB21_11270 [Minicystis sp.]|nr:hypothetical protein [Minicystis sp.]